MILLKDSKIKVTTPGQTAKIFRDLLLTEDRIDREKEHYYVLHLDARNKINLVELVGIGTINTASVHPRETYRRAVAEGSVAIIVAHNHPSGEVTPSDDDIMMTKKIQEAGKILGIPLLDHVVFSTGDNYYSFTSGEEERIRPGEEILTR